MFLLIVAESEDLMMLKSRLTAKYLLFEHGPEISPQEVKFTEEVSLIRQGGIKITQEVNMGLSMNVNMLASKEQLAKDFMQAEQLGTEVPRRCKNCKGCQTCGYPGWQMTDQESEEFNAGER